MSRQADLLDCKHAERLLQGWRQEGGCQMRVVQHWPQPQDQEQQVCLAAEGGVNGAGIVLGDECFEVQIAISWDYALSQAMPSRL